MTYEERYYNSRKEMCDAFRNHQKKNTRSSYNEYVCCANKFNQLCSEILEQLLEENSDILKRLKEI